MTTIAIVGSRHWTDYAAFCELIRGIGIVQEATTIVSGKARGVDDMAERFANQTSRDFRGYAPDLTRPFTIAAHQRNQRIIDDLDECRRQGERVAVVALPGPVSTGTPDTIRRAMRQNIEVIVREVPE